MPATLLVPDIDYPDSDGKPMSDNTVQFRWIMRIKGNLDYIFYREPNVFVAGDHLIYPVEGQSKIRVAPDAYVAFGPEKKDRGSYKVWEEGGIFPQVVFEVWSPGNDDEELAKKMVMYEKYGAEEYYLIHPDEPVKTAGWVRVDARFERIKDLDGWVSPRLKVRFALSAEEWELYGLDGAKFLDIEALRVILTELRQNEKKLKEDARRERKQAAQALRRERDNVEKERKRAERAEVDASKERDKAQQAEADASKERDKAQQAESQRQLLAAKLRELGIDPDRLG